MDLCFGRQVGKLRQGWPGLGFRTSQPGVSPLVWLPLGPGHSVTALQTDLSYMSVSGDRWLCTLWSDSFSGGGGPTS